LQTALEPDTVHDGLITVTVAVLLLPQPALLVTVAFSVIVPAAPAENVILLALVELVMVPLPVSDQA